MSWCNIYSYELDTQDVFQYFQEWNHDILSHHCDMVKLVHWIGIESSDLSIFYSTGDVEEFMEDMD